jgi:hypothetical protein
MVFKMGREDLLASSADLAGIRFPSFKEQQSALVLTPGQTRASVGNNT